MAKAWQLPFWLTVVMLGVLCAAVLWLAVRVAPVPEHIHAHLTVSINGVGVCRGGAAGDSRDQVDLTGRRVLIEVALHAGTDTATVYTNDLSHAYVEENSAYSS